MNETDTILKKISGILLRSFFVAMALLILWLAIYFLIGDYWFISHSKLFELTEHELGYTLNEVNRILKPGGLFLVIDETRPQSLLKRLLQGFLRSIFKLFVFLISGTTTKALKNFPNKMKDAGFEIVACELNKNQNLLKLVARKNRDQA